MPFQPSQAACFSRHETLYGSKVRGDRVLNLNLILNLQIPPQGGREEFFKKSSGSN